LRPTDPIQPSECLPIYFGSKIVVRFLEIREASQWVGMRFGVVWGFPTIESLGWCHCKTSVLSKLNLPQGGELAL
jgi:hypothetical protein